MHTFSGLTKFVIIVIVFTRHFKDHFKISTSRLYKISPSILAPALLQKFYFSITIFFFVVEKIDPYTVHFSNNSCA